MKVLTVKDDLLSWLDDDFHPEHYMPKPPTTPPAGTAKIPKAKVAKVNPLTKKPYNSTKWEPATFPTPSEPAAMPSPSTSIPISDYPASVQDEIMDIFRGNARTIGWAASQVYIHKDSGRPNIPRGDEAGQRVLIDFSERIVRIFLERHSFDKTAALLTFQEEIKKRVSKGRRIYLEDRQLMKGIAHLKWYIPNIDNILEAVMAATPFTPERLAVYHSNLLKVFDAHNSNRRRNEPQLVLPTNEDPEPLELDPLDDF